MNRYTLLGLVFCALALMGCASTRLETPLGTYYSTRDSELQGLVIEIVETPDGGKTTRVEVGGASGSASPVVAAQAEFLRAAMEAAFALGKAAP